jgi:hypothetical protein
LNRLSNVGGFGIDALTAAPNRPPPDVDEVG